MRGLGRVSYGVYLWHWPAVALLTPARVGVGGVALLMMRLGATAAGTTLSWLAMSSPMLADRCYKPSARK